MAIGITTMTGMNYGSVLQAYSLQESLKTLGVEAYTIQLRPKSYVLNFFRRYVFPNPEWGFWTRMWRLKSDVLYMPKSRLIRQFWEQNTSIRFYRSRRQFIEGEKATRVLIAGSDQIWNPAYIPNFLYYLLFANKNTILFSYAASLAADSLTETAKRFYHDRLRIFSGISVRETTGKQLLSECIENDIRVDLDPVFLLTKDYWDSFASDRFKGEQFVFLYVIKPNMKLCNLISRICSNNGMKVYYIGDFSAKESGLTDMNDASVQDFLSLIKYSAATVTNSFHATAFSILMNKPFFSYVPPLSGSRIIDILNSFGMQDHIIDDDSAEKCMNSFFLYGQQVDYEFVNTRIEQLRRESMKYLNSIAGVEKCT